MGYPHVLDETRWWKRFEGNRCNGIRRADVQRLRGTLGHLNHQIGVLVEQMDGAHEDVDFIFVDPTYFFEGEEMGKIRRAMRTGRHGTNVTGCAARARNGSTASPRERRAVTGSGSRGASIPTRRATTA